MRADNFEKEIIQDTAHENDQLIDLDDEIYETQDPVRIYFNKIGKTALLSAEQEVEISKRIEAGLYAKILLQATENNQTIDGVEPLKNLSIEQSARLSLLASDGELAKKQMIEANLRLVVSHAKRYVHSDGFGLSLLDLIQEGNTGLIKAVEKFDYKQGYKFSTYATWWIRQSIARGITNKGRTIRLPYRVIQKINLISTSKKELNEKLGREPSAEEIANELQMATEQITELMTISQVPTSLDAAVGENGIANLGQLIVYDDPMGSVENQITKSDNYKQLEQILKEYLNEKEYIVIKHRFGLMGSEPMSSSQIAEIIGHPSKYIASLESRAIKKLQKAEVVNLLYDYIS